MVQSTKLRVVLSEGVREGTADLNVLLLVDKAPLRRTVSRVLRTANPFDYVLMVYQQVDSGC